MKHPCVGVIFAACVLLVSTVPTRAADGPYAQVGDIPIGGAGSWDYLRIDSDAKRLYVSHGTEIVVVDVTNDTIVGRILNTPGIHGIALAPELGRGFTSNGRDNSVSIVDLKTLQTLGKVSSGGNPDTIFYDSKQKEVYAFNGAEPTATPPGHTATVIDAATGKVVTTIDLGGRPETAQADPALGRLFVNLEDKDAIAAIDMATHKVVATWPIAPGEEPSGLAIDAATHHLFAGAGQFMVMLDTRTGKVLAQVPIGEGTDATWFDPGTNLAFSSCSDGTTTIAHEDGEKLTLVQTLQTTRGARTMTIDPATHKIYLGAAKYQAPVPSAPTNARPLSLPDSFHVLVYGMSK
jgi:hypothetical protein